MNTKIILMGAMTWGVWLTMGTLLAEAPSSQNKGGQNLIPNSSFEEMGNGVPENWRFHRTSAKGKGMHVDDPTVAHSGERCVMVEFQAEDLEGSENACIGWGPSVLVKVKPNTAYTFSGWIKAENCVGKGAWFWIFGYKAGDTGRKHPVRVGDGGGISPKITYVRDSAGWEKIQVSLITGKEVDAFTVWLRLDGPGRAWFDDVALFEKAEME